MMISKKEIILYIIIFIIIYSILYFDNLINKKKKSISIKIPIIYSIIFILIYIKIKPYLITNMCDFIISQNIITEIADF